MISFIDLLFLASNIPTLLLAAYFYRKAQAQKHRPDSVELKEFMMDLLSGDGLIHVKRVAPTDIVIRARRK